MDCPTRNYGRLLLSLLVGVAMATLSQVLFAQEIPAGAMAISTQMPPPNDDVVIEKINEHLRNSQIDAAIVSLEGLLSVTETKHGTSDLDAKAYHVFLSELKYVASLSKTDQATYVSARRELAKGESYYSNGQTAQAEEPLRNAAKVFSSLYGEKGQSLCVALHALGTVLLVREQPQQAREVLKREVEILHETIGDNHPQYGVGLRLLANAYLESNELDEADRLIRKTLLLHRAQISWRTTSYILDLETFTRVLIAQSKFLEAEGMCGTANGLLNETDRSSSPLKAMCYSNMAEIHIGLHEYPMAEKYLRRALAIFEAGPKPYQHRIPKLLKRLSFVLRARGSTDEADTLDKRAASLQTIR